MPTREVPLMVQNYGPAEIKAITRVLKSGRVTQGPIVAEFEAAMHKWLCLDESKATMMVNSGSSANLLAAEYLHRQASGKPVVQGQAKPEVITTALTWSTTVAPLIQKNFTPVFIDVGPDGNMDIGELEHAIKPWTAAIAVVHLLGHPANMTAIKALAQEHNLLLWEDCCEALGAKWDGIPVGNYGDVATYSFYMSHHLTTIEGGLIVYPKDFHPMLAWREHGWHRRYPDEERAKIEAEYPSIDPRFLFVELGYNLRSTDLNAAMGLIQLQDQDYAKQRRQQNAHWYQRNLTHPTLSHPTSHELADPNPFNYCIRINANAPYKKQQLEDYLSRNGIETRPVMTGNIMLQPYYYRTSKYEDHWTARTTPGRTPSFGNTWSYHLNGLLLPCHQHMVKKDLEHVKNTINDFLTIHTNVSVQEPQVPM